MKKMWVLGFFLLIGCAGMQLADQNDFAGLSKVHEVSALKNKIYDSAMVWVATKYVSPKKVMEYNSKEQGLITFNGAFTWFQPGNPFFSYDLNYKITLHIRDKKYKIEMIPLPWRYNHPEAVQSTGSPIKDMVPAYINEFNRINDDLNSFINGGNRDDF